MVLLIAIGGVLLGGCGPARQDAHEPKGRFAIRVLGASFPAKQSIAHSSLLELRVRNAGMRTVPNLAVTIKSFASRSSYPNMADRSQPVWIVDQGPGPVSKVPIRTQPFGGPGGLTTANSNTWAAGPLAPGQTRTFVWRLTPVVSGRHTITYAIDAGPAGKAQAYVAGSSSNSHPGGRLTVQIAGAPRTSHVDPSTGQVLAGPLPLP